MLFKIIDCSISCMYFFIYYSYTFIRQDTRVSPEFALVSPPLGGVRYERECEKRCNSDPLCRSFNHSPFYQLCELLATDYALLGYEETGRGLIDRFNFEVPPLVGIRRL